MMKQFVCSVCGFVYDEAAGLPEQGIAPGTKWDDLPEDWTCPLCGAAKAEFNERSESAVPAVKSAGIQQAHEEELHELTLGELSALFSNLAKGCEKQYRPEEAGLFGQLADYYQNKSKLIEAKQLETLTAMIQQDLDSSFTRANAIAADKADRGALRALVWGEKVTRILSSILSRFEKQKDVLLENTNIYVCEICGFVFIGNEPPEICPVCKVPNMKIRRIEREAV